MIEQGNTQFRFGEYELDVDRRVLLRDGEQVPLKAKAFDLLRTLVENRGTLLSRSELLDRVWENQFVEENNLSVHIAALRKALGEKKDENRYIVTVPGKGYKFVAEPVHIANGNVVVESRKFQTVVVSEEIEEISETPPAPTSGRTVLSPRRDTRLRLIVATLAILVLAIAAALGVYALRNKNYSAMFAGQMPFKNHEVIQLTTNGKVGNAALSPDGKSFAYVIDDLGQKSLWVGKVAGGNHLQLHPPAEATYTALAFSPDGDHLYYSLRDEKNPQSSLYSVPALGGLASKLRDGVGYFSLSPDGQRIAMGRRDRESDVVVVSKLDGSEAVDIASLPKDQSFVSDSISWSPDATRVAFSIAVPGNVDRQEVGILELATGVLERLSVPGFRHVAKTMWTRNGDGLLVTAIDDTSYSSVPQYKLAYVSYPTGSVSPITTDRSNYGASWHNDAGATLSVDEITESILTVEHRQLSNVWVAPAEDLNSARQITFGSFGRYDGLWGLDWTPDGKLIYTTSDTQNQYLAQMSPDGSGQKQLSDPIKHGGHVDSVLTVSTDGRYILFHSDRGEGEMDIWRSDIDGSNPTQLTFGGKAFQPAPSPDGRWVYYRSRLNSNGVLCRVAMNGGEPKCVTDKETGWMSFSPDGKFLAASYLTDKRRLAIISAETHEIVKQFDLPKTGTLYMGSRWTADGKSVTYRDTAFGYWVQDVDGGEPRKLEGLPNEKFYNFSWSRDGRWLALVRGQEIRDVVLFRQKK